MRARNARDAHVCVCFSYTNTPEYVPASPRNRYNSMNSHALACGDIAAQVPAENTDLGPAAVLYVATDLSTWCPQRPEWVARECQLDDVLYRRLDPEYFAWLRYRMFVVKHAADSGRVQREAFDALRTRFNAIQERAIYLFGQAALIAAAGKLDPESYRQPLVEPEDRAGVAAVPVPARRNPEAERLVRARQLVDEIRDQALALGWMTESLYFSDGYARRPFAARYGLVCYIGAGSRIGEVIRQSIEIIGAPPAECRMRFYNPDVAQPWAKRAAQARLGVIRSVKALRFGPGPFSEPGQDGNFPKRDSWIAADGKVNSRHPPARANESLLF